MLVLAAWASFVHAVAVGRDRAAEVRGENTLLTNLLRRLDSGRNMSADLPFTISHHALDRALEMNVSGAEIRTCFEHPSDVRWSAKHEAWCYTRGRISLGVSEDRTTVITVLWASQHGWRADYARGGDLGGRERRTTDDMKHLPRRRA